MTDTSRPSGGWFHDGDRGPMGGLTPEQRQYAYRRTLGDLAKDPYVQLAAGPLPVEYRDQLEWGRLRAIVAAAINRQPRRVRDEMASKPGLRFRLRDFDDDGYCCIEVQVSDSEVVYYRPIARVHWSRLMPSATTDIYESN
jgi:hypothetical protein